MPALLPVLPRCCPVEIIRARLADHLYRRAGGLADRCIEIIGLDFEFGDRVRIGKVRRSPAWTLIRRSVNGPGVPADIAADVVVRTARIRVQREIVVNASGLNAGSEFHKQHGAVAHDREFHDLFVIEDAAGTYCVRLKKRSLGGDRNAFRHSAEFEREVDLEPRRDRQNKAPPVELLEPGHLGCDFIRPGQQQGGFVISALVGLVFEGNARIRVAHDDGCPGDGAARRVKHSAEKAGTSLLRQHPGSKYIEGK